MLHLPSFRLHMTWTISGVDKYSCRILHNVFASEKRNVDEHISRVRNGKDQICFNREEVGEFDTSDFGYTAGGGNALHIEKNGLVLG